MRNVLLLELISRELVSRDNSSDSIACVPINNNIKLLFLLRTASRLRRQFKLSGKKIHAGYLLDFCLVILIFLFYLKFESDRYDKYVTVQLIQRGCCELIHYMHV